MDPELPFPSAAQGWGGGETGEVAGNKQRVTACLEHLPTVEKVSLGLRLLGEDSKTEVR